MYSIEYIVTCLTMLSKNIVNYMILLLYMPSKHFYFAHRHSAFPSARILLWINYVNCNIEFLFFFFFF